MKMIIYFETSIIQMKIQMKTSRCLHSSSRRKIEIIFKIEFQLIKMRQIKRQQPKQ